MPFPPGPLVCISSTASFVCVSNTGSVFRSTVEIRSVPSVMYIAADPFGDHHVGCGGNGDRIFRHDSIRDAIFSAAQTAALAPRKEFPSLIPGCRNRPADVFLPHWDRGLPTALDVSVISTLQQRTVRGAAENQGYALSICEERKMATHAASCREVGISFIPLAVESLGGWSDLAAKTISRIGRLLGQRLGIPPSITSRQLFQRCSVSLWRGNAALWLHRFPPISSFIDSVFFVLFFFVFFVVFLLSFLYIHFTAAILRRNSTGAMPIYRRP